MPTPIMTRVAFQGGGARLADLLPIVAAIQKAVIAREIFVTHVSGTSAGSIAAALIATQTDVHQFRTQVVDKKASLTHQIQVSKPSMLASLVSGKPVLNKKLLKRLLFELFSSANPKLKKEMTLSQLGVENFTATVTEITSCTGVKFSKILTPQAELFEVVTNSCSVPFVFKFLKDLKGKSADPYVDGGVVQNFPIDDLVDGPISVSDMILGFGFTDDFNAFPVQSRLAYGGRILSAAMQSSMEYAKRRVGSDRVYEIESKLDTFQFHEAIEQTVDAGHFIAQQDNAYDWILKRAAVYRTSYERITLSHVLNRVKEAYETYVSDEQAQDRSNLLRVTRIDSMFPESGPDYSASDRSYTRYNISFDDKRMNTIRIANPLDSLTFQFNDSLVAVPEPRIELCEGGQAIGFTSVPTRGITKDDRLDHLVFFKGKPGAGAGRGRRIIEVRQNAYHFNGLTGLRPDREGFDFFVVRNQGLDPIDGVTMIFYVPKTTIADGTHVTIKESDVEIGMRANVARDDEVAAGPGRRMLESEINALSLPPDPQDSLFFRIGWLIPALPAKSAFGLNLSLPAFKPKGST